VTPLVGPLWARLLRVPIIQKILLANTAIVVLGAVAGTMLTAWYVRRSPGDTYLPIVLLFATTGTALSIVVNWTVLRLALRPLAHLERVARRVQQGDLGARAELGPLRDPHTDRLAETLNNMLDTLASKQRAIERYSEQLQALSARVLSAQEEERKRIARELHDETGQALTSLAVGLRVLQRAPTLEQARAYAGELSELTHQALEGVHELSLELRPKTLDDLGLVPALRWFATRWSRTAGVEVDLHADGVHDRLPSEIETVLYRVVQEALTNVAKHAQATRVEIAIEQQQGAISARVSDNGRGLTVSGEDAAPDGTDGLPASLPSGKLGLFGMQERVSQVGGTLHLDSPPRGGTTVIVRLP
jgi:two-component system sensor histidine kinase UhpB